LTGELIEEVKTSTMAPICGLPAESFTCPETLACPGTAYADCNTSQNPKTHEIKASRLTFFSIAVPLIEGLSYVR
jgi:hypothetical protein